MKVEGVGRSCMARGGDGRPGMKVEGGRLEGRRRLDWWFFTGGLPNSPLNAF